MGSEHQGTPRTAVIWDGVRPKSPCNDSRDHPRVHQIRVTRAGRAQEHGKHDPLRTTAAPTACAGQVRYKRKLPQRHRSGSVRSVHCPQVQRVRENPPHGPAVRGVDCHDAVRRCQGRARRGGRKHTHVTNGQIREYHVQTITRTITKWILCYMRHPTVLVTQSR